MKKYVILTLSLLFSGLILLSQNPICPPGVYMADPSAKVFDGKLYLYTSTDESCDHWCSWQHDILHTDDMINWSITENVFHSKGENDQVSYNDKLLFAPDCAYANDTFYLYYCQPDGELAEGVASSANPDGPFTNANFINTHGNSQIDPSCFIDDDGTAYYLWGQFGLKMAKLKPGMRQIDPTTLQTDVITEKEHYFHEGAYMTKRNGIYYLIYADISREGKPTCIGYASSKNPFGPYKYGGVIVDNDGANPNNWNNHGSIAEFNGQWYVFYHRSTHACGVMRKSCVEKIEFLEDGSIPEVEMTSQGAADPFLATEKLDASRACLLQGKIYVKSDNADNEILTNIHSSDKAVFKYLNFAPELKTVSIRARSLKGGSVILSAGKPWHHRLAAINVEADNSGQWKIYSAEVEDADGIEALWMQVYGEKDAVLMDIDWIKFE